MTADDLAAGLAAEAAQLGTCALSDALDALGISGVLPGLVPLSGVLSIAGRAVTVELGPAGSTQTTRHLCAAAVDSAGAGDVIVVAHPGPHDGAAPAGWGGILSMAAQRRGVAGVVVSGAARDVDEARDLGFGVFGARPTPVTARGRIVEVGWGEAVRIGAVTVRPGDLVVADENGVVVIPASRAAEVLDRARTIVGREAAISDAIRDGAQVSDAMGRGYEAMLS